LIWIEILSSEDKPVRVARKVKEVVEFGATYVWVIDPESLESYVTTKNAQYELRDGVFRIEAMDLSIPLADLQEA
jgi:Uma2 family endonuclease